VTDTVEQLASLESSSELHEARLLILLAAFRGDHIEGLTKLAKLDFLLRYPTWLERALEARGASARAVAVHPCERESVESQMVRYRFGPWDHRYRYFLNLLAGKGLARIHLEGRTVVVGITEKGLQAASELASKLEFQDMARRAKALNTHFDLTATTLMNFIYKTFPEVASLRKNEPIGP
jgi:hypothetical protein